MKKSSFLPLWVWYYYFRTVLKYNNGSNVAGAGAEIMDKGGAGA